MTVLEFLDDIVETQQILCDEGILMELDVRLTYESGEPRSVEPIDNDMVTEIRRRVKQSPNLSIKLIGRPLGRYAISYTGDDSKYTDRVIARIV
tara:strand:+ start:222 stop:503 length:282 start_codon:yes stop_codon:yes gene_type:complete